MTIDAAGFLVRYPEFGNQTDYTPDSVSYWLGEGYAELNAKRLPTNVLDRAVAMFAAHNLVVGKRNMDAASNGGTPGELKGPLSARSIDKVSNTYDAGAVAQGDTPGFYNQTNYGIALWALLRRYNAGPIYVPGPRRIFDPLSPFYPR